MTNDNAGGGRRGLRATSSEALLATVREQFGLRATSAVIDLGGSANLTILVDGGDQRVVVRVYRPYVTEARLRALHQVRRELAAGGIPCPSLVSSRNGQPWVLLEGRLVEVERYVEHSAVMDTWERLERGLPLLGRIHTLLQAIAVNKAGKRPMFANHIEPRDLAEKTRRGVKRMRRWASTQAEQRLIGQAEELARLLVAAEPVGRPELPRQLTHGDFWDNNVLFQGDDVAAIIDFDFMGERPRIDDLALTLYFQCLQEAELASSVGQRARLRQLVDSYDSGLATPLSEAERLALPVAMARQPLWSIGGWVAELDDEAQAREHALGTQWAIDWALRVLEELELWQGAFGVPERR